MLYHAQKNTVCSTEYKKRVLENVHIWKKKKSKSKKTVKQTPQSKKQDSHEGLNGKEKDYKLPRPRQFPIVLPPESASS